MSHAFHRALSSYSTIHLHYIAAQYGDVAGVAIDVIVFPTAIALQDASQPCAALVTSQHLALPSRNGERDTSTHPAQIWSTVGRSARTNMANDTSTLISRPGTDWHMHWLEGGLANLQLGKHTDGCEPSGVSQTWANHHTFHS